MWQIDHLYAEMVAVLILGVALVLAILYGYNELAMSIASGLVGYIGGASRKDKGDEK